MRLQGQFTPYSDCLIFLDFIRPSLNQSWPEGSLAFERQKHR